MVTARDRPRASRPVRAVTWPLPPRPARTSEASIASDYLVAFAPICFTRRADAATLTPARRARFGVAEVGMGASSRRRRLATKRSRSNGSPVRTMAKSTGTSRRAREQTALVLAKPYARSARWSSA